MSSSLSSLSLPPILSRTSQPLARSELSEAHLALYEYVDHRRKVQKKRSKGDSIHRKSARPPPSAVDKAALEKVMSIGKDLKGNDTNNAGKSSIIHVLDRRIDFDSVPADVGGYELARMWVRDDPWRGRAENIRVSAGSSGYRPVTDGREDDEETSAGVTEKKMDVTGDIGMTADLDAVREGMLKRARESREREVEKIKRRRRK